MGPKALAHHRVNKSGKQIDGRGHRARRTKAKIRRVAGDLIISKGIDNTTVEEITAAAGIAKGTFYLHFKGKDDLVLEYAHRRLEHVKSVLPEILLIRSTHAALHEVVRVVVKGKDWHPDIVKIVVLKIAESFDRLRAIDLRNTLLPVVELGVARAELRTDIEPPILASAVADTIYCGLRNWGMGLSYDDLDKAIEVAVDLAYDAVRKRQ
jgi:AcrR family transcriptional regulator